MAKKKKSDGSSPVAGKPDTEWRAESDARTLTDAEAIRCDPKRLNAARGKLEHSVMALRKTMAGMRGGGKRARAKNGRL